MRKLTKAEIDKVLTLSNQMNVKFPMWRYGQSFFNALYELYPEVADSIRGTENDCFYSKHNRIIDTIKFISIENN